MKPDKFKYKTRKLIEGIFNSLMEYMRKEYFRVLPVSLLFQ